MSSVALVVFLPLLSSLVSGLGVRVFAKRISQFITVSAMFATAFVAISIFKDLMASQEKELVYNLFNWINIGAINVNWAIRVDMLTAIMLVVVCVISLFVHIYSIGYMANDHHVQRFMFYITVFTFFMLVLVVSDNMLQLFVGWEGVGLCSYLLVGFWFKKESANKAALKAFCVNRIADFAFVIGLCFLFEIFGSLNFSEMFAALPGVIGSQDLILYGSFTKLDMACLLIFIGCMGKSAQIILHVWLPDAMEGPTPVSALIHAATMVTAGVFLLARLSPIFEHSPFVLSVITLVGTITAIFAALTAISQNDIKKIIAYSTCSQLGYMFFACGVGAYSAGIFHLFTHAFFKALLFLGAGAVIHYLHHEQDIRNMGRLAKKIPLVYICMLIGTAAIVGFPPFAGYYSKDIILESAFVSDITFAKFAFYAGVLCAFLTSFYSFRLLFMVFHGPDKHSSSYHDNHESGVVPCSIKLPIFLLAVASIAAGFIAYDKWHIVDGSLEFWRGAIIASEENEVLHNAHHVPSAVKNAPLAAGLLGLVLAYLLYIKCTWIPGLVARKFSSLYNLSLNKFYFDEAYSAIFVKPFYKVSNFVWQKVDVKSIDGAGPVAASAFAKLVSTFLTRIQTGFLYDYIFIMVMFVVILFAAIFV